MDRLLVILVLAALASGCKERAEKKPAATGGAKLTLADLEALAPKTMAGLPRKLAVPSAEVNQLSLYYQDEENTRSGHVVFTLLSDPPRTLTYYEKRFSERATIGGRTAYTRQYKPNTRPETAEGCLMLAERVGVCVDLAPAVLADLAPLFQELPLAEIEKRAR